MQQRHERSHLYRYRYRYRCTEPQKATLAGGPIQLLGHRVVRYLHARGHHENLDLADWGYALDGAAHPRLDGNEAGVAGQSGPAAVWPGLTEDLGSLRHDLALKRSLRRAQLAEVCATLFFHIDPRLHLPPPRVIVIGHASLEREGEGDLRAFLGADARWQQWCLVVAVKVVGVRLAAREVGVSTAPGTNLPHRTRKMRSDCGWAPSGECVDRGDCEVSGRCL